MNLRERTDFHAKHGWTYTEQSEVITLFRPTRRERLRAWWRRERPLEQHTVTRTLVSLSREGHTIEFGGVDGRTLWQSDKHRMFRDLADEMWERCMAEATTTK